MLFVFVKHGKRNEQRTTVWISLKQFFGQNPHQKVKCGSIGLKFVPAVKDTYIFNMNGVIVFTCSIVIIKKSH